MRPRRGDDWGLWKTSSLSIGKVKRYLETVEMEPTERETLARAFRTLHTVKGTAGFLCLTKLQGVAHSAENLLSRLRDGSRRVTHITEVDGMEGDKITLQDIFLFDFAAGVDHASGKHRGILQPTGVRPSFSEKLEDTGVEMGAQMFEAKGERSLKDRMKELR